MLERLLLALIITGSLVFFLGIRSPSSNPRSLTSPGQPVLTADWLLGQPWLQNLLNPKFFGS
jgi:hypothetical protein